MEAITKSREDKILSLSREHVGAKRVCVELVIFYDSFNPSNNPKASDFFNAVNHGSSLESAYRDNEPLKLLNDQGLSGERIWELYSSANGKDPASTYFSLVKNLAVSQLSGLIRN